MREGDVLAALQDLYASRPEFEDRGVPEDDLIARCVDRFGEDEATVEQAIDYLKKRGELYASNGEDRYKPTTRTL